MGVIRRLAAALLILASWTAAQDEDEVLAALIAADEEQFAALAKLDEPDPWLIAARLAAAGKADLALRFSQSSPRPAVAGLAAFLESAPPFDARVRMVRDAALAHLDDERFTQESLAADLAAIDGVFAQANRLEQAQFLAIRGFLRVYRGDVDVGQKAFLEAEQAARALGWLRGAADALGIASENARVLYDPDTAAKLARRELDARWELGDAETTLVHLRRLVEVRTEVGDWEAALEELKAWTGRLGEPAELDCAGLLLRMADPEGALEAARRFESGRARLLAGDALRQLGRESDALAEYRLAVAQFEKAKDDLRVGHALGNAGISLVRLGRGKEARPLLERAQMQFDRGKDRGLVALAVLHRGDAHLTAGEAAVALRLFDTVRTFASRTGDAWLEAEALVRRGRAQLALDETESARKSFTACRSLGKEFDFPELMAAAALGEARCYMRAPRPQLAAAAARRGLDALAPLVEGLAVPEGDEVRRLHGELGAVAIEAALALDSDRDLWMAVEQLRLGIPRRSRAQGEAIRRQAMTPAQVEQENELRKRLTRLSLWEDRARQEDDLARAVRFKADREAARRKLDELIEAVQRRGLPGWEQLFPRPTAPQALRALLDADETLASVVPAGKAAVAILLTRAEMRRLPIERDAELDVRTPKLTLVGPAFDLRWRTTDLLRAPSATEAGLLRRRTPRTDPLVLARPPDLATLRSGFLDGSLRILAPRTAVEPAAVETMRRRLASGEEIHLPPSSQWSWWGRR